MSNIKVLIYCRVSTKEQTQNLSLETQERECRRYCKRKNLEVVKVFVERGESAKTTDRTQLQKMLEYCRNNRGKIEQVVVFKLDRLSRSNADHHTIRAILAREGARVRSVTERIDETSSGKLMENMISAVSQYDNDVRAERTIEGMKSALKKGQWTYQAPLGYLQSAHKPGPPSLIPDPERADYIRTAFKMYVSGHHTKKEIVDRLNAEGMRTHKGNRITPQTLNKILTNAIYSGWMVVEKWEIKQRGDFEPLITEETFLKAQQLHNGNKSSITNYLVHHPDFPLRRFLSCPKCSKPLTGSKSKGRKERYPYYHCPQCKGVRYKVANVEKRFMEHLSGLRPVPEVMRLFLEIVSDLYREHKKDKIEIAKKLSARISSLEKKKEKLLSALVFEEKIDKETYEEQRSKIQIEIDRAVRTRESLEDGELNLDGILSFAEWALLKPDKTWRQMGHKQKQVFQRAIYPKGLSFDGIKFRTAEKSFVFSMIKTTLARESKVASPGGLEPSGPYGS